MPYLNDCTIMGNLTKAPELRYTPQGSPVCELTIAVNRKSREREEVCYIDAVAWGKAAENCQRYLAKGSCVLIQGYLKQESWDDRNGGGRRTKLRIVAENIQFITTPKNAENHATEPPQGEYDPPQSQNQCSESDQPKPRFYGDTSRGGAGKTTKASPASSPSGAVQGVTEPEDDIPF